MAESAEALFAGLAALDPDSADWDRYVYSNPALLRGSLQLQLVHVLEPEPPGTDLALRRLSRLRSDLELHKVRYPLGRGPVEQLWAQLQRGEIHFDDAKRKTESPEVTFHLGPAYVYALSEYSSHTAHMQHWRKARQQQELLVAAVRAFRDFPEFEVCMNIAGSDWVEVALCALCQVPDGRLLRSARELGEDVVKRTERFDVHRWHAITLYRLGVLHMQPYVYGKDPQNYRAQEASWYAKFQREYGLDAPGVSPAEWKMPPVEEALAQAEIYLRQAVKVASAREKGQALKTLAETLLWRRQLGAPVPDGEMARLAQEALRLVDHTRDAPHVLWLSSLLKHGLDGAPEAQDSVAINAAMAELGARPDHVRVDAVMQFAMLHQIDKPRAALDKLLEERPLIERAGSPEASAKRRQLIPHLLFRLYVPKELRTEVPEDWTMNLGELRRLQDQSTLVPDAQAAWLLHLASICARYDSEAHGLELVEEVVCAHSEIARQYEDVLTQLRADLSFGEGANCANKGRYVESAKAYLAALGAYAELGMVERLGVIVHRVTEVLMVGKLPVARELPALLTQHSRLADLLWSDDTQVQAQGLWSECLRILFEAANTERKDFDEPTLSAMAAVIQAGKGSRFAQQLQNSSTTEARALGSDLLQRIGELETTLAGAARATAPPNLENAADLEAMALDEELQLLSYIWPGAAKGSQEEIRLENSQRQFDQQLQFWIAAKALQSSGTARDITEIRESIPHDTLLLAYFCGNGPNKALGLYLMVCDQQTFMIQRIVHDGPGAPIVMQDATRQALCSSLASVIRRFRRGIKAESGFAVVEDRTAQALEGYQAGFLGDVAELLEVNRRRGKKHLCIVPHGPLHYFPFHLLGPTSGPLADAWNVTYLPSLALLGREYPTSRTGMVAIGISFESSNPRREAIPEAVSEAQDIARGFGSEPILENHATRENTIQALRTCRYVHISTHGAHNYAAPSFSCLYLAPNEAGEDRLFAYDVEELDLHGLDVITLSACETALGRFDVGDNMRGLPASFFRAGVATIIGTLWETDPDACKIFFECFYSELRATGNKMESFRAAQVRVRREMPEYRHWGAFFFMGDWGPNRQS